jgi:hypothetical protein
MSTANVPPDTPNEDRALDAIHRRARELADQAPPLTSEQMVLLRAVFSHPLGLQFGHPEGRRVRNLAHCGRRHRPASAGCQRAALGAVLT